MIILLVALLFGIIAGLRAMTAPALVSWAAHLGWLPLQTTLLAFLDSWITVLILTVAAAGELVTDKLPKTPSRKIPMQFGARIVMGAFSGAAIGLAGDFWIGGLVAGIVGAVIGTLAGADVRGRLAASFGTDLPAALLEDVVAVGGGILILAFLL